MASYPPLLSTVQNLLSENVCSQSSTVRERGDMRSVLFAPLSDAKGFLVWTLES